MNKKAFTLIELIAVIVIMGLLLLIVFPATSKLMKDNETKVYTTYYTLVGKAIDKYATSRRDDVGGITGAGCVDDTSISDLIELDLINPIDVEQTPQCTKDPSSCTSDACQSNGNLCMVECKSPSEFTSSELRSMKIDPDRDYANIRIENKEGIISTEYSMICRKGNKVLYSNLIEDSSTCSKYVAEVSNTIVKSISSGSNKINSTLESGTYYLVNGDVTNNYVWYSGKLWRIIGYNTNEKTVKMITDDVMAIASYDMNTNNYVSSNIYTWLNSTFINTLKNADKYLLESAWNYSLVTDASKPSNASQASSKVGLLSFYEYNRIQGFLRIGQDWWLSSNYSDSKVWYVSNANIAGNSPVNVFYGVRPVVVLRPNVTHLEGGNGTITNPYRITGDISANIGAELNNRSVGEYVKIDDILFRIVSTNANYTRLISDTVLDIEDSQMHYYDGTYSSNTTVGTYLNVTWKENLSLKDKLNSQDFCRTLMTPNKSQTTACPHDDLIKMEIAIPKLGDMFTTASDKEYWTLTNSEVVAENPPTSHARESKMYVIGTNGIVTDKTVEDKSGIRPVINLDSDVKITGGNGTKTSPYTVE